MIFIRSLIFNVLFYFCTAIIVLLWLPTLPFGRHMVFAAARAWCTCTLFLLRTICNIGFEVRGLENIPAGGYMLAAKHQSAWETAVILRFTPDYTFVLKHELTKIPLFGWYLRAGEQIAIDRSKGGSSLSQVIKQASVVISQGRQLIIFPEGTRRAPGAPPHYKFGVAHIYGGTKATCVPAALNSGLFWGRNSFLKRPGKIVLSFLEPILPGLEKPVFFKLVQERIETETAKLIAESLAADPSLVAVLQTQPTEARPATSPSGS